MEHSNEKIDLSSIYAILDESNRQSTEKETETIFNLIDLVKATCEKLKISEAQFCNIIQYERKSWTRIVSGEHQKIDVGLLVKLAQFLNIEYRTAVNMVIAQSDSKVKHELENTKRYSYLINNFDINQLRSQGFISSIKDLDVVINRIQEFFGLKSIYDYDDLSVDTLYSKGRRKVSNPMLVFWTRLVRQQMEAINNPNEYDEDRMLALIPQMREATLDVSRGFKNFIRDLYNCGVTVIVESYLSTTSIYGGTFIVNKKPCVVLTDYMKRYDTLWMALAHELHHIINDYDVLNSEGYHITGEDDHIMGNTREAAAEDFSEKIFASPKLMHSIERYISMPEMVKQHAEEWGVYPSLIYGIYLKMNPSDRNYKFYRKYLLSSEYALKNIKLEEPWKSETIQQTVEKINQSFQKEIVRQK